MVWDIRPRIPTVKSMSALPMAGLAYAVGSKSQRVNPAGQSVTSSPPPEYDPQSAADRVQSSSTPATLASQPSTALMPLSAEDLERALRFEQMKHDAHDRSRYITQGSLMLRSSQEAQFAAASMQELQFSKELYLSSLEYLMRGIPADLSPTEKESLNRTLRDLQCRLNLHPDHDPAAAADGHAQSARTQQLFVGICRGTAVLIKLSVPRIKRSLESAIEFENRYHVLERSTVVLANSLTSVADRATRTTFPVPDMGRLMGLASNIYFGLSVGLQEGYRVLNDDQAV